MILYHRILNSQDLEIKINCVVYGKRVLRDFIFDLGV